jgi:hypothetical protein
VALKAQMAHLGPKIPRPRWARVGQAAPYRRQVQEALPALGCSNQDPDCRDHLADLVDPMVRRDPRVLRDLVVRSDLEDRRVRWDPGGPDCRSAPADRTGPESPAIPENPDCRRIPWDREPLWIRGVLGVTVLASRGRVTAARILLPCRPMTTSVGVAIERRRQSAARGRAEGRGLPGRAVSLHASSSLHALTCFQS